MTAFYTGRAFFMTFWGPEKLPSPDDLKRLRLPRSLTPLGTAIHRQRRPTPTVKSTVTVRAGTSGTNRRR